jgi:ubiquinone/menaquinone biosynthesis C-methylase UbiE
MGVETHLGIRIADYDRSIRAFIPDYEEMLDAAAAVVAALTRRSPDVVDLGTGSGALAARVMRACRDARVVGIDADAGMLAVAQRRLKGRLRSMPGDFLELPLPRCDAITASFSLHHVQTSKSKATLYARCFDSLESKGVFVNADCCLSSNPTLQARDRAAWHRHLTRTYGRTGAERHLRAWAKEDFYLSLEAERELLSRAGFQVDVVWRHNSFAVIAATKADR